jgi:cell pole-organizing protein PopZ
MSNVADASEPSMQDILASIRKIISDEDPPEESAASPAAPEDVFEDDGTEAHDVAEDHGADPFEALADEPAELVDNLEPEAVVSTDDETVDFAAATPDIDELADAAFDLPDDDDDGLLELTPDMALDQDAPAPIEAADDDLYFGEDEPEPVVAATPPIPEPQALDPEPVAPPPIVPPIIEPAPAAVAAPKILSDTTDAAVGAAFGQLNSLLLSREARTVEDLIRDMLQPMLKGWLDENLPGLVEKIVREEIERVSRETFTIVIPPPNVTGSLHMGHALNNTLRTS